MTHQADSVLASEDSRDPHRAQAVRGLLILCGILLIAFTAYGMLQGNSGLLDSVLALVRDIVIVILGWAIGRSWPPRERSGAA